MGFPRSSRPSSPRSNIPSMELDSDSGYLARENLCDGDSSPRLPSGILAVKQLARSKRNLHAKYMSKKSFEERRLKDKEDDAEISEEAKRAWDVGKKLGLLSKISDDEMRKQIVILEREDRATSRKAKQAAKKGAKSVHK